MNKIYFTVGACALLTAAALGLGCDDDENKSVCTPRDTRTCTCPNGSETGVETCKTDGTGWGLCNCAAESTCADDVNDFDSCLDCFCEDEVGTCNDNADCLDLLGCVNDCSDDACTGDCSAAYPEGVDDLVEALNCRDSNCAAYMTEPSECADTVTDFDTCLDCYCADEVDGCFNDDDCYGLYSCFEECGDDTDCINGCATDFEAGIDAYNAIYACSADYCMEYLNDPTECADSVVDAESCDDCYCYGFFVGCVTNDACIDLSDCLYDCAQTDTECIKSCVDRFEDGYSDLFDYSSCLNENCADYED